MSSVSLWMQFLSHSVMLVEFKRLWKTGFLCENILMTLGLSCASSPLKSHRQGIKGPLFPRVRTGTGCQQWPHLTFHCRVWGFICRLMLTYHRCCTIYLLNWQLCKNCKLEFTFDPYFYFSIFKFYHWTIHFTSDTMPVLFSTNSKNHVVIIYQLLCIYCKQDLTVSSILTFEDIFTLISCSVNEMQMKFKVMAQKCHPKLLHYALFPLMSFYNLHQHLFLLPGYCLHPFLQ